MSSPARRGPEGWRGAILVPALVGMLAGCLATPSASPSATDSGSPTASATATQPSSGSPGPTPEPPLSLALPGRLDAREVSVRVTPDVAVNGGGEITVVVQNKTDKRIHELVLRWPIELRDTLFLAPFEPSEQRIREFGPPLHQDWTSWVDGPGERGEPAGTTSLGWGPLMPNATLTIPILVSRRAAGEVAFDLQVLADERVLTLPDGSAAELRVSVP
ncbi:MAG TPA: hypothetical protein VF153_06335 [Candidatus Limnocylindria bacterium]